MAENRSNVSKAWAINGAQPTPGFDGGEWEWRSVAGPRADGHTGASLRKGVGGAGGEGVGAYAGAVEGQRRCSRQHVITFQSLRRMFESGRSNTRGGKASHDNVGVLHPEPLCQYTSVASAEAALHGGSNATHIGVLTQLTSGIHSA